MNPIEITFEANDQDVIFEEFNQFEASLEGLSLP